MNSTYVNYKYVQSEKSYFDLKLNINPNNDSNNENIEQIENNIATNYTTLFENNNFNFGFDLSHYHKFSDQLNFKSQLNHNYSLNKKKMQINSLNDLLFNNSDFLFQDYTFKNAKTNFSSSIQKKSKKNSYSMVFDFINDSQNLNTNILDLNTENDIDFDNKIYSLTFKNYNFLTEKFVFSLSNKINYYDLKEKKHLEYVPSLTLAYNFTFSEKLNLNFSRSNKYYELVKLNTNPIVLNYRTNILSEVSNSSDLMNTRTFSLNYVNFNTNKEFHLFIDLSYSHNQNSIILTNEFSNGFIINKYVLSPFEDIYSLKFNIDKRFRTIPMSIKNFIYLTHSKSLNYVNNTNSILTNNTIVHKLNLFSHFKESIIQIECGYQGSLTTLTQSVNNNNNQILNINAFLKAKGKLNSNVIWDLKFTNLYQESLIGKNNLFFVSPNISKTSKNNKWTYSIWGNNIFNLKNNIKLVSSFTNVSVDNTETSILDGYLMFGAKFNF